MSSIPNLSQILVFDIETAASAPSFDQLPADTQDHWQRRMARSRYNADSDDPAELYTARAALQAEFSSVVAVAAGYFTTADDGTVLQFRVKSTSMNNERELLEGFSDLLARFYGSDPDKWIAGHNVSDFDIPFLCRRLLINDLPLISQLDSSGRKPWEMKVFDTYQHWRFGGRFSAALDLLAHIFDIESPKTDMDGAGVHDAFWSGKYQEIAEYCRGDVIAVGQLLLKFQGLPQLSPDQIIIAE